jgi:hypothetical protein
MAANLGSFDEVDQYDDVAVSVTPITPPAGSSAVRLVGVETRC